MNLSEFDYELPEELIAQRPLERREDSRMLVLYRGEQRWEDRRFVEFPSFLRAGDCLVLSAARASQVVQQGATSLVTPRRLIVVLLGSNDRFSEGAALLSRSWAIYDGWAAAGRPINPKDTLAGPNE